MKTALLILVLSILQPCAFAGVEDIQQSNRVILKTGVWIPADADAQEALLAVQSFLEKSNPKTDQQKREAKSILNNTKAYRVQFVGLVRDGKKIIHCNFFRSPQKGETDGTPYWKKTLVAVCDGGFWYWQVDYDPSTGKCLRFVCNGYA